MATCFIFAQHLSEAQGLCLRLGEDGQEEAPLALRAISELRALQQNARTVVVLPADFSTLHELELPWLPESKARAAIPYALEEVLAQNVAALHFAFDRHHYSHHRYLIVVTDKQKLFDLIARLDALDLDFDSVTLDWFALKAGEICRTESGLLIHDDAFKGALSGELSTLYLNQREPKPTLITFKESGASLEKKETPRTTQPVDSPFSTWVAQRLLKSEAINLCQGDLRHDNRQQANRLWYRVCAVMAGVLVASVLLFKLLYVQVLTTKTADVDKKIAVIYRQFFPEAKQVISPKFRMGQLLSVGTAHNGSAFWILLDKLAHSFKNNTCSIEQFQFQNQVFSVTLVCQDFAALEALEQQLQQAAVTVTQVQAASHKNQVTAILELSL